MIEITRDGDTVRVRGSADIYHAAQMKEALAGIAESAAAVRFDLSQATEFDSAGFQLLEMVRRSLASRGGAASIAASIAATSAPVAALLRTYRCEGRWAAPGA
jgi:anti-anti-sigma regulatory factor